jgi:hypothetical protein
VLSEILQAFLFPSSKVLLSKYFRIERHTTVGGKLCLLCLSGHFDTDIYRPINLSDVMGSSS